jgi:hypothetical protein
MTGSGASSYGHWRHAPTEKRLMPWIIRPKLSLAEKTMRQHVEGRTPVFFVARCHRDLSGHLSVDTLRAANEEASARKGARSGDPPRSGLRLVKPGPTDTPPV